MANFAIKVIPAIDGKQQFYQLVNTPSVGHSTQTNVNQIDGILDVYEKSLEGKYMSSFRRLVAIMDRKANLEPLGESQFRDITPNGESVKEYEFKAGDLRVYGIKGANCVIMLLGGYKNQQKADLRQFRSLKEQYLNSINKTK